MKPFGNQRGFTLLEMLLALALGALLMSTISTAVMPLLQRAETNSQLSSHINTSSHAEDLLHNIAQLASNGELLYPNAIDRAVVRTGLAIKLRGTGFDMYDDANGDGMAGIAAMEESPRGNNALNPERDDDQDGLIDEDPLDGIDNDYDGLIDEDPGNNQDSQDEPGIVDFDDNGDGVFDAASTAAIGTQQSPWMPFVPNSIIPLAVEGTDLVAQVGSSAYRIKQDDNEDGIANNGSLLTWSARLEGTDINCRTPLINHDPAKNYATFSYRQYICLENVSSFNLSRVYNIHGQAVLDIALSYSFADQVHTVNQRIVFP